MRTALRSEAQVDLHVYPLQLDFDDGAATLEGETANIAAKKLALEVVAALPEVAGVVDRLRVRPAAPMGDREIGNHVRDAFVQEPAFADCALYVRNNGDGEQVQAPDDRIGEIEIAVADGVVTLNGYLPTLARKRLADRTMAPLMSSKTASPEGSACAAIASIAINGRIRMLIRRMNASSVLLWFRGRCNPGH